MDTSFCVRFLEVDVVFQYYPPTVPPPPLRHLQKIVIQDLRLLKLRSFTLNISAAIYQVDFAKTFFALTYKIIDTTAPIPITIPIIVNQLLSLLWIKVFHASETAFLSLILLSLLITLF